MSWCILWLVFDLNPVSDERVFTTARHTHSYEMKLPVDADVVWKGLVADRPLAWCRALSGGYTSEQPFGVGTTRTVTVSRALVLRERFFVWDEENRHHSFYVEQTNLPLFSMFAEAYRVTPTDTGCTFTWKFAMEGRAGTRNAVALSQPLTRKLLLERLIRDTEKHFVRGRG